MSNPSGESKEIFSGPERPQEHAEQKAEQAERSQAGTELSKGSLNDQAKSEREQAKSERGQTLEEQIRKTGSAKIGPITNQFGQSIEITETDPSTGDVKALVKGRSKEEVASALSQMQAAQDKGLMIGPGGKFIAEPTVIEEKLKQIQQEMLALGAPSSLFQEKPVLIAQSDTITSDAQPSPAQALLDARTSDGQLVAQATPSLKRQELVDAATTFAGEIHGIINFTVNTIAGVGDAARMAVAAERQIHPMQPFWKDPDPEATKKLQDTCAGMTAGARVLLQYNTTFNPQSPLYGKVFDPEGSQMAMKLAISMPIQIKQETEKFGSLDREEKAARATELALNIALIADAGPLAVGKNVPKFAESAAIAGKLSPAASQAKIASLDRELSAFLQKLHQSPASEKLKGLIDLLDEKFPRIENPFQPKWGYQQATSHSDSPNVLQMAKPKAEPSENLPSKRSREKDSGPIDDKSIEAVRPRWETIAEHPFLRDVMKKVGRDNTISSEDGQKVCDLIAESIRARIPDIDGRNISFAVYTQADGQQKLLIGTSKAVELPGLVPLVKEPTFKNIVRAGNIDVRLHSEYKILEELSKLLKPGADGKLALYSEQIPCRSCEPVIREFLEKFKSINFRGASYSFTKPWQRENANALRTR